MAIDIHERAMTDAELARMYAGFGELASAHGVDEGEHERHGVVALDRGRFVGCSSGLAYRGRSGYGAWFSLTDLFVEATHRGRGVGRELLARIEARAQALGIENVLTWTTSHEAPRFYAAAGYVQAMVCEGWHPSGEARIALVKHIRSPIRRA